MWNISCFLESSKKATPTSFYLFAPANQRLLHYQTNPGTLLRSINELYTGELPTELRETSAIPGQEAKNAMLCVSLSLLMHLGKVADLHCSFMISDQSLPAIVHEIWSGFGSAMATGMQPGCLLVRWEETAEYLTFYRIFLLLKK